MPAFSLLILAITTSAAASILWFTFSLGISPVPSSIKVRRKVLAMAEEINESTVADLGSGWGSLVIPLARHHPECRVTGYEASWVPWLFSISVKHLLRLENLTLKRSNFLDADLSSHRVLVCYLFRGGMERLDSKLKRDKMENVQVISHTFALPGRRPDFVVRTNDLYRTPVYHYRL